MTCNIETEPVTCQGRRGLAHRSNLFLCVTFASLLVSHVAFSLTCRAWMLVCEDVALAFAKAPWRFSKPVN